MCVLLSPSMGQPQELDNYLATIAERLDAIDAKLDTIAMSRKKSMEWIAQMSEHIRSLDSFREEVRVTLEPLFAKLENMDEGLRVMRHATSDVSRRMEALERPKQAAVG